MGRIPRIHVPGGIYHVILQGNNGESLFLEDEDHWYFHNLLGEGVSRFGHSVHALCSMTNHVHLGARVAEHPLGVVFHHSCLNYSKWFNKKYDRKGHLFKGPYKAILVETQSYLLELIRYVHLNPVRAGMVERPEDYKWSSFRAYLGEEPPRWLTLDWVLGMFSEDVTQARVLFREFTYQRIDHVEPVELRSGKPDTSWFLRSSVLTNQVRLGPVERSVRLFRMEDVIRCVCSVYGLSDEDLRARGGGRQASEARVLCAALVREIRGLTLSELSKYFGRALPTLSKPSLDLLRNANTNSCLVQKLEQARNLLEIISRT